MGTARMKRDKEIEEEDKQKRANMERNKINKNKTLPRYGSGIPSPEVASPRRNG